MKLIVDANIVFSAILNTESRIADLILNSVGIFEFYAPAFLRQEIKLHYPKISKISGLDMDEIREIEFLIYQNIHFINEEQIAEEHWIKAYNLVADIDEKDISYIAFTENFNCKIWSGDKKLITGLKKKNYTSFLTTLELLELRSDK